MTEDWTPQYRLQKAREREHVVSAIVRAQSEWRDILEALEQAETAETAKEALRRAFGFTQEQALAVMDTQFRRVSRQDRDHVSDELTALREEIAGLEDEL